MVLKKKQYLFLSYMYLMDTLQKSVSSIPAAVHGI